MSAAASGSPLESLTETASMGDVLWGAVSIVVLVFFFALILHSIWKAARAVPPAVDRAPGGVRGGLLAVVAYLLALGLFRLASATNITGYLNASAGADATLAMHFKFAGPAVLAAVLAFIACRRLACSRRPSDPAAASVIVWLVSVGYAWLAPVILGQQPAPLGTLAALSVFSAAATLYLFFSPRARHTYGFLCGPGDRS